MDTFSTFKLALCSVRLGPCRTKKNLRFISKFQSENRQVISSKFPNILGVLVTWWTLKIFEVIFLGFLWRSKIKSAPPSHQHPLNSSETCLKSPDGVLICEKSKVPFFYGPSPSDQSFKIHPSYFHYKNDKFDQKRLKKLLKINEKKCERKSETKFWAITIELTNMK